MTHSWHTESHYNQRNNWLRATVLGANDGLISTASLLMGMMASHSSQQILWLAGIASLVAGAISMGAGEYVSVSSQADTEKADLAKEANHLDNNPEQELKELSVIYEKRGLSPELAEQVAIALHEHDALTAHARDEIGITEQNTANPLQACIASAFSFCLGAVLPLLVVAFSSSSITALAIVALLGLVMLGALSAKLGGAKILPAVSRIVLWGIIALVTNYVIGRLFDVSV